jgi:uncharacterized membrane protein
METLLHEIARHVAIAIQAVAVLVVAIGTVRAVVDLARVALAAGGCEEQRKAWVHYARWLVAGLTFQLAADIVSTSVSPTWDEMGRLAGRGHPHDTEFLPRSRDGGRGTTATGKPVPRRGRRAGPRRLNGDPKS